MPAFSAGPYPISWAALPEKERASRSSLATDNCIIDKKTFIIRGSLELPVLGEEEVFSWGVWVAVSEGSHTKWKQNISVYKRSHVEPLFGWLNSWLRLYPETMNLKVVVRLRDAGASPLVLLEPTDHPLAIEQRTGITRERVMELHDRTVHPTKPDRFVKWP